VFSFLSRNKFEVKLMFSLKFLFITVIFVIWRQKVTYPKSTWWGVSSWSQSFSFFLLSLFLFFCHRDSWRSPSPSFSCLFFLFFCHRDSWRRRHVGISSLFHFNCFVMFTVIVYFYTISSSHLSLASILIF
jgi:hypothetical protein